MWEIIRPIDPIIIKGFRPNLSIAAIPTKVKAILVKPIITKLNMIPLGGKGTPVTAKNRLIPDDRVLIRADKWTEWHYFAKFMTQCSQPYAAFWKLELALSEEDMEQ